MEYNNDELYHYGRLGMKWGQHIFGKARSSNKSSSRYAVKKASKAKDISQKNYDKAKEDLDVANKTYEIVSSKKKKGLFKKKTTEKTQKTETKSEDKAAKKEAVLKSRSAKQLYDNADLFTDQELQSAYNRLVLERNIQNLTPKEVSKGEQYVNTAIKLTNKTATLIENSTKAYNAVAKIYNTTSEGQKKPIPIVGGKSDKKKDD